MFPRFLENLLESGILFCCAMAVTKTALGIIQLWFNYCEVSFCKALDVHFSREVKDRDASVVGAFTPVSLSVYRDDQFAKLSVPFQNAMPPVTQWRNQNEAEEAMAPPKQTC